MKGLIAAFASDDPLLVDDVEDEGQLAAHPALGEGPRSTLVGSCCAPIFPQLAVKSTPPPLVGDGPKTFAAEGWDGAAGGPDDEVAAAGANGVAGTMGDDPKSDVPVDFPSLMTTVFLNKSSRSLRAAYLSSALSIAGLEALGIAGFFGVMIPELKKQRNRNRYSV